ncbi:Uncharacterised protein [uncultured Clostridium sp.]|uniref:hypothetical protein n=1 Tax=uncultured Clostridium sp. TaxID=59620 RepID=UPI00082305E6|nr:hypothetical protein [uncultured Clostridium sp.]SCI99193.1 Uncharacterised protein [uncultured Clostridium sp.]
MEIGITLNNNLVYNKEFSKKDKRELRQANELAGWILKNSRLTKCAVVLIAGINFTTRASADVAETMSKVDAVGFQFLGLIQYLGFWICLLGCLLEILFAVFKEGRGKSAILPIFLKWFGIFAGLYLIPEAFKMFKGLWE